MPLRAFTLLVLVLAAPSWAGQAAEAAAESRCVDLTELGPEQLATYDFDGDRSDWTELGADERYQLGAVTVVRQDVFEAPSNRLHRAANRYHRNTRAAVIESILPMAAGDPVDQRLLDEAERILRRKSYLYDARVFPQRRCGDRLDIYVVVRDVWTLVPRLRFDRAGGENETGFGISDRNLLGTGKALFLGFEKDEDRRGTALGYSDPNVNGSRWTLDLTAVDNDDGGRYAASLEYPFYALHARHAFALEVDDFRRDEGLYFLSDELWEYRAESQLARLEVGQSSGLVDGFSNRLIAGIGFEEHEFDFPRAMLAEFPGIDVPDRTLVYPYIGFERLQDDYDTRINLDRVQRTEDIALGSTLSLLVGWSSPGMGGDTDRLIARIGFEDAEWLSARALLSHRWALEGYYRVDDGRSENLLAEVEVSYRWHHAESLSLLVRGSAAMARNQTLDRQLLLGGEEGLRGYPTRYQVGDRRFLLTVEERYYSDVYPFQMFRLGGALFLDVGRAWYEGDAPEWLPGGRDAAHFGVLSNVGVGLRLESTRTRRDRLVHLDLAVPLQSGPDTRELEVTLSIKQSL